MTISRHYQEDRARRERAIEKIGLGEVVHTVVMYDEKRKRSYLYEITTTAVLMVKSADRENFLVTRYPARPSRIKKYWKNAPREIIELSVAHTRMGLVF